MAKQWCYLLFLLWFSYLLVSSILLFTNGFLLSRVAQLNNSTCTHLNDISCNSDENNLQCNKEDKLSALIQQLETASNTCLKPRAKIILLIIDAFRYDFALFNDSNTAPLPYQNKVPVLSNLLLRYPENSRLYKFIADPPTTTMQRIKALTTGSLPTFIDAGSNFATHEINEDNLIDQLGNNGYNTVFMGDDTWDGLYPNRFLRNYPYPSFHVWDLDTVDNGVRSNLYPEMKKNDWQLLIGHFLGVDHCGHKLGPNHPEMGRKLTEMNADILKITNEMDDNTLLMVIGDHGMTSTGDHGGESENEVTATMFTYSKNALTDAYYDYNHTIKQVDLVPTIAIILGIPIPHSNLGSIIYDSLPVVKSNNPNWFYSLIAAWSNVQQLTHYIEEYSKTSDTFGVDKLEAVNKQYMALKSKLSSVLTEKQLTLFIVEVNDYIKFVRLMCEEVWVEFDAFSMSRGLLLVSVITIFVYMIIDGIPSDRIPEIFDGSFIVFSYVAICIAVVFSGFLYFFNVINDFANNLYFSTGIVSIFMLAVLSVQNFEIIAMNWYDLSKCRQWSDICCRVIFVLSIVMLFANSFILQEAKIMLFFLVTLMVIIVLDSGVAVINKTKINLMKKRTKLKVLFLAGIICVLIRVSVYFWKCREEHGCDDFIPTKVNNSSRTEWFLTLIAIALFVIGSKMWLRTCGNIVGFAPTVLLARYAPTVMVVCCGGFWILHRVAKDTKHKLLAPWQADMLAWIVYFLFFAGGISMIVQPLCVYILPRKQTIDVDSQSNNVIPQLFKKVYTMYENKKSDNNEVPVVCGLATAYSASYIIVTVYFGLVWALLLGDATAPSAIALILVAAFILVVTAITRFETASKIADLFEVPTSSLLVWYVLSIYMFYGTGHQPTFTNISWDAAFVGTGSVMNIQFIPGLLIIVNTFGSQIIMGLTLPMLLIAPFTLYVIMPGLSGKKNEKDLSRGDMLLYENDQVLLNNVFILCCKYIICHATRVFASMLSCTILCRHLMVWNLFAPKLIFEALGFFVTTVSVLLGYLLLMRINVKVDSLIKCLNKQYK